MAATAKIKMRETYGRLVAGQAYRVDAGTAASLVRMDVADVVPERKGARRRRK